MFGFGKKKGEPEPPDPPAPPSQGFLSRLKRSLSKTAEVLNTPIGELFSDPDREKAYRDLEIALVRADVGGDLSASIVKAVREREKRGSGAPVELLKQELLGVLRAVAPAPEIAAPPRVVFFVGVNGTGKTTTIAKVAARSRSEGEKPVVVACDTFRAAAIDQLAAWTDRAGVPLVRQAQGADPAAVLHDGLTRARERGESPVLVDTAGRLHVKTHLMEEMAKMSRVAGRLVPGAPHEAWLVLDATTGQNGLAQAREFGKALKLTGVVLTKLDGTAKGGVAFAIARDMKLPIVAVGVGESIEDLLPFDAEAYVDGLLGVA
jgi:fused signal recognition particle receptor